MKERKNNCSYKDKQQKESAKKSENKAENKTLSQRKPVVLDLGSPDPDTVLFDVMERICSR